MIRLFVRLIECVCDVWCAVLTAYVMGEYRPIVVHGHLICDVGTDPEYIFVKFYFKIQRNEGQIGCMKLTHNF